MFHACAERKGAKEQTVQPGSLLFFRKASKKALEIPIAAASAVDAQQTVSRSILCPP